MAGDSERWRRIGGWAGKQKTKPEAHDSRVSSVVEICSGQPWIDETDQGGLPGQRKSGDFDLDCRRARARARGKREGGQGWGRPGLTGPKTKRGPHWVVGGGSATQ